MTVIIFGRCLLCHKKYHITDNVRKLRKKCLPICFIDSYMLELNIEYSEVTKAKNILIQFSYSKVVV